MNGTVPFARELTRSLRDGLTGQTDTEIVLCPPFTALDAVARELEGSTLLLGAQNLSERPAGAFTGEIAAEQLASLQVRYVIVGHSERRQYHQESDALVARKAAAAFAAGLTPIVCLGETLEEREAGNTEQIVGRQLTGSLAGLAAEQIAQCVLAYEPVWAIGTGKTASAAQAQSVHAFLRARLTENHGLETAAAVRIQYGGSVKPDNARELLTQPDVDGALIGGASLKADSFSAIIRHSA